MLYLSQGYGVKTSQQTAGDKSLGQRCNTHSAMVLRALVGPRLLILLFFFVLYIITLIVRLKTHHLAATFRCVLYPSTHVRDFPNYFGIYNDIMVPAHNNTNFYTAAIIAFMLMWEWGTLFANADCNRNVLCFVHGVRGGCQSLMPL